MKHKILLGTLCATAAIFCSCNEEDIVKMPNAVGDEIVFGARAGFENADNSSSRTVYSGTTYKEGDKTYERIDWVPSTDIIQIYCPEAHEAKNTANYVVTTDASNSYSILTKCADEVKGIQWGNNEDHTFYAMYPSTKMITTSESLKIKMEGTIVNGYIPESQEGTIEETANGYVIKPNMNYAYMIAGSTVTKGDPVNLTFYPLVTALEMTFINDSDTPVSLDRIEISPVKDNGDAYTLKHLNGYFECDLSEWEEEKFDKNELPQVLCDGTHINMIPLRIGTSPMTLNQGESVTFTVFISSGIDKIKNLKVEIISGSNVKRAKILKGIDIRSCTRHIVNGLTLPTF